MKPLQALLDLVPAYRERRLEQLAAEARTTADLSNAVSKWSAYVLELREQEKSNPRVQRKVQQALSYRIIKNFKQGKSLDGLVQYKTGPLEEVVPLQKLAEEALAPMVSVLIGKTEEYHANRTAWNNLAMEQRRKELQDYTALVQQTAVLSQQVPELQAQLQTIAADYLGVLSQQIYDIMNEDEQFEKTLPAHQQHAAHTMLWYGIGYSSLIEKARTFYQGIEKYLPLSGESASAFRAVEQRVQSFLTEHSVRVAEEGVQFMVNAARRNLAPLCEKEKQLYQGRITEARAMLGREITRIREVCAFYKQREPKGLEELEQVSVVN